MCHSDLHLIDNDLAPRFPIVGGHEGAGIIEQVGAGVTKVIYGIYGIGGMGEKTIKGTLFGSANPQYDIVRLLRLYDAGQLKLDELVTTKYTLDQVNEGDQDLRDGKNIRGVLVHAD